MKKYTLLFFSGMLCAIFFGNPINTSQEITQNHKEKRSKDNIKLLVLIIASDDYPVYKELQKLWRSYMHYDKNHVEAYFIRGDPDLATDCEIHDDVIWTKTPENLIPGITNKTILSLEAFLPRIKGEFDYILRTNLSSFYVFPRLLEFLGSCQKNHFYCGSMILYTPGIASGCGFLITPDIAEILVQHKSDLVNNTTPNIIEGHEAYDDIVIGALIKNKGIPLIQHPRMDFCTLETWHQHNTIIPENIFQFRVKSYWDNLRLTDDIYIQSQLLKMFY